jgi:methyltransferase, FkbM family
MLPENFRSKNPIRTALMDVANSMDSATFVNIGANDGLSGDHLREFIMRFRWKGILVEPVPYVFHRLISAYRGQHDVFFAQVAISDSDGTAQFWHLRKNNELRPGYDQIGSFSKDYVLAHQSLFPGLEKYLTYTNVKTIRLQQLLDCYRLEPDVILIDAEGYDSKVVKQINFTRPPRLIIFEHCQLAAGEKLYCRNLLLKKGYLLKDDGYNTIATQPKPPTGLPKS